MTQEQKPTNSPEQFEALEKAVDAAADAFEWLAENNPKAMREMPGELFFPLWRTLNAMLPEEEKSGV